MNYTDIPTPELNKLKLFASELESNINELLEARSNPVRVSILKFILAGSWANNSATEFSDYDLVCVLDTPTPYQQEGYEEAKNIICHCRHFKQRDYGMTRFVDTTGFCDVDCLLDMNPIFGVDLMDGTVYTTVQDIRAAIANDK